MSGRVDSLWNGDGDANDLFTDLLGNPLLRNHPHRLDDLFRIRGACRCMTTGIAATLSMRWVCRISTCLVAWLINGQSRRGSWIFCGLLSGPRQHRSSIVTCVRPFTETGWETLQRRPMFFAGRRRNACVAWQHKSSIVTCIE